MTRRTSTVLSMAAGVLFSGGVVLAQQGQQGTNRNQPGQNTGLSEQAQRAGQNMQDTARQMGGQVEQQLQQQLTQIAQDPRTAPDKLFILHAAMGNQMEIELARQAQQKAQNQQVKQLAQQIIQDHEKASQQLRQIAQQLDVDLPQSLPQHKQQEMRILTSLPAEEFEKHYVAKLQANHAHDLIAYRACGEMSKNPQVRQYAEQQLPALSRHYDHVEQAAVALGLPSGGPEAIPAAGRIQGQQPNQGQDQQRMDRDRNNMNRQNNTGAGGAVGTPGERSDQGPGAGAGATHP